MESKAVHPALGITQRLQHVAPAQPFGLTRIAISREPPFRGPSIGHGQKIRRRWPIVDGKVRRCTNDDSQQALRSEDITSVHHSKLSLLLHSSLTFE